MVAKQTYLKSLRKLQKQHSILRFVGAQKDGKPVVLTNLSIYDDGIATLMRNILMEHFKT